jgi:hypothetical protein
MHRLSPIILLLGLAVNLFAQNPHGADFKTDCATCHTSAGWDIEPEFWINNNPSKLIISDNTRLGIPFPTRGFDHNTTDFTLEGQHTFIDCRDCHQSLVFSEAQKYCFSCHTDMHNQTVGYDCARCHNPENWLVADISQLHYDNGFPLLGAHFITNCYDCHISETDLRFERIGNDCMNCHMDEYSSTTNPNHIAADFSTNCIECHSVNGFDWTTENINHEFFPLSKGHDIVNCAECHTTGDYNNTPTDCFACHLEDYNAAINPNHQSQNFPADCMTCHTTEPDWTPATFANHDVYYELNGAHATIANDCAACHSGDYINTPNTCVGCHLSDYNNTTDPSHSAAQFPTDCESCHSERAWAPATFDHDGQYFPINGGKHREAWNQCADCHSTAGNYSVFSCIDCHEHNNQADLADKHSELPDYTYTSQGCFDCHPTGNKD